MYDLFDCCHGMWNTFFPVKKDINPVFWQNFDLECGVHHVFASLHIVIMAVSLGKTVNTFSGMQNTRLSNTWIRIKLPFCWHLKVRWASIVDGEKGGLVLGVFPYWGHQKKSWGGWLLSPMNLNAAFIKSYSVLLWNSYWDSSDSAYCQLDI